MDKRVDSMADKAADASLVTKVMTFKSGKVAMSRRYHRGAVWENLVRFESLFGALSALPIVPGLAAHLDTELVRRSIFGTAAIEGNQLPEERVGELLTESLEGIHDRAEQEILNLGAAYKQLTPPAPGVERRPFIITEAFIKELNDTITAGIPHEHHSPGQYRNVRVEVGDGAHGGKYVPPKALADIQTLMTAFVDWINSEEVLREGALVRAALAHYHLGLIHPFGDGNGRTARLLEAVILNRQGYRYVPEVLSNCYYKNIDDYYIAFREAEKSENGDITAFLAFFFRMLVLSIEDILGKIHGHIRILALRDYHTYCLGERIISQRQYDLLRLLLSNPGKTVSLSRIQLDPLFAPLYRRVSEKTARRDVKHLETLQMLRHEGKGYGLNPFTLD